MTWHTTSHVVASHFRPGQFDGEGAAVEQQIAVISQARQELGSNARTDISAGAMCHVSNRLCLPQPTCQDGGLGT